MAIDAAVIIRVTSFVQGIDREIMKTEKVVVLPDDLAVSLRAQPQLLHAFEQMRPSCQRGYIDWIEASDAKKPRDQRIERVLTKISKWGERHHLSNEPRT